MWSRGKKTKPAFSLYITEALGRDLIAMNGWFVKQKKYLQKTENMRMVF